MSGKVVVNRSMSLDGFISGPDDAMDWIFDFVAPDAAWLAEIAAATGAMLIGRRTDEVGNRMEAGQERGSASRGEGYPFTGPMFVLNHRPPDLPDPDVTYLTGDIGEAVATALDAAGGKNLEILGADVAGRPGDPRVPPGAPPVGPGAARCPCGHRRGHARAPACRRAGAAAAGRAS
jgi:dihydrofolate reductase